MPDIYVAPQQPAKKKALGRKSKKLKKKTSQSKEIVKSLNNIGIKPSVKHFTAFAPLPKKISFETQEKDEKIVLLLRRHWVTNLSWGLIVVFMALAPLVLFSLPLLNFLPSRFQLIAVIMWYLIILGFSFDRFLCWFFNVYIITDERIIDVDFISLVYREISQAQIDKIQDVTYKGGGLLKSIFNFGDVYIQTAAETQKIEFELVPQPAKVVQLINQLIIQEEQEKIEGRVR